MTDKWWSEWTQHDHLWEPIVSDDGLAEGRRCACGAFDVAWPHARLRHDDLP
jgi:hypothetical protein